MGWDGDVGRRVLLGATFVRVIHRSKGARGIPPADGGSLLQQPSGADLKTGQGVRSSHISGIESSTPVGRGVGVVVDCYVPRFNAPL